MKINIIKEFFNNGQKYKIRKKNLDNNQINKHPFYISEFPNFIISFYNNLAYIKEVKLKWNNMNKIYKTNVSKLNISSSQYEFIENLYKRYSKLMLAYINIYYVSLMLFNHLLLL